MTVPLFLRHNNNNERGVDEEWCTPLDKISQLYSDDESWCYAKEILELPSAACRKIGDEARGLASRHVIDRLKEKNYLSRISSVAPRLRSAVELLSKPDADYVYPPVQFLLKELRTQYPQLYDSVSSKMKIRLGVDTAPRSIVVTMAKYVFEKGGGELSINWGKFISLLALCGALAVDSVDAGYPEGVTEVVDTFGLVVEQVMGEWICGGEGGGWDGLIKLNEYEPILPPIPRTILILTLALLFIFLIYKIISIFITSFVFYLNINDRSDGEFWAKWVKYFPKFLCRFKNNENFCLKPTGPLEFLLEKYTEKIGVL